MSVSFSNQLTPNNVPFDSRIVVDGNFIQNVALPAGGAVSNTNAIDLQQAVPYGTTELFNVQIIIGTQGTANTANSKNCNGVLQETTANSDGTPNSSNWHNITELNTVLVLAVDNAAGGWAASSNAVVKLSPGNQRFIRGQFALEANGGNAASANGTVQLLF